MNPLGDKLQLFYNEVDSQSQRLAEVHAERLQCQRGCSSCCVDGITIWNVEAENIRQNFAELLINDTPNTRGGCAFLDENGGCRIYQSRPYVCRTQGLPLRWLDEIENEIYELRDICPLNENGIPIEELDEIQCWTIGSAEAKLGVLESEFDKGEMRRVALRELFGNS